LARPPVATLSPNTECAVALSHPCWLETDEAPLVSRGGALLGVLRHRILRSSAGSALAMSRSGLDTALEMGELFWLGLQGILDTVLSGPAKEVQHD
jgi:hypothetical protein